MEMQRWKHASPGFLNLATTDILGYEFFVVGSCPRHRKMLSRLFDVYPLDASTTFAVVTTKNIS